MTDTDALAAALPCEWFADEQRDCWHSSLDLDDYCANCITADNLRSLDAPTRLAVARALAPEVWEALDSAHVDDDTLLAVQAERIRVGLVRGHSDEDECCHCPDCVSYMVEDNAGGAS